MTERDIETFKTFFARYVSSFYSADPEDRKNIALKEEHSFLVCRTIRRLAGEQNLAPDKILVAEAIGLFHDIGRFPQYARYKTFRDSLSVNHGVLGAETLREQDLLRQLPPDEQRAVLNAVRFHNAYALPSLPDAGDLLFLRLVRDADKLDIWRIFLGFFEGEEGSMASAVGLGLPETSGYSRETISCIREGKSVSLSLLKNVNDFVLMQLSWVYDLNFPASFSLLEENDFIRRLVALLPATEEIREAGAVLKDHASRMRTASGEKHGDGGQGK
jgi:hypothetical protein